MIPKHVHRLAVAVLAAVAALALVASAWPDARLTVSTGSVETGRGEPPVWKVASAGELLGAGDRIRTGPDGRAEVVLDGATLRVYPNSLLRLPDTSNAREVEMESGASLFDVKHTGEPFEVRTREVVVSVKGTRFGVALDGEGAAVSVFRGLVGVRGDAADAGETLVQAGFAARGNDSFELSWHGNDDAWEAWEHGGSLPDSARGVRREAALRDAHKRAVDTARELPPEKGEPGRRGDRSRDGVEKATPAALDPDLQSGPVRDVVADASGALSDTLERNFVGDVVEDLSGGLLTLNFYDGSGSSGSDRVVLALGNETWSLQESELDDLPTDLIQALNQNGISDAEVVNQVARLFQN
jgi:hypothetical protein